MPALHLKALVMISSYTSSRRTFITCCLLVQLAQDTYTSVHVCLYENSGKYLNNAAVVSCCTSECWATERLATILCLQQSTNYAQYAIKHLVRI